MKPASWSLILSMVFSLSFPSFVYAQEGGENPQAGEEAKEDAGSLYQQGLKLFRAKRFAEAAVTFEKALKLDPDPILAYNTARAHENNGDLKKARAYYVQALELGAKDKIKVRCEDAISRIDRLQEWVTDQMPEASEESVLEVEFSREVQIFIDGKIRGMAPSSFPLPSGHYLLELKDGDRVVYSRQISMEAGERLVVDATPEEEAGGTPAWVLWSGGSMALTGLLLMGLGSGAANDAQEAYDEAQALDVQRNPARFQELRDRGEESQSSAVLLYASGGVLGAAGAGLLIYAFFWDEGQEKTREGTSLHWGVGPREVRVGWSW